MNAVVTGASKGLGYAIAARLAKLGYNLYICSRNSEEISSIANELSLKYGINVHSASADLSKKEEVKLFAKRVNETFSKIDVLVNNAGVFLPGQVHLEEEGTLEFQIETNLYSAYYLTRNLMGNIFEAKQAHIFNICSIASKIAYPNGGSYSISKFALLGFSKALREELKQKKIKVTAILPGAAWSHSWKDADLPYERLMEADDVAKAVEACLMMSPSACVEEIVLRPQLGDL